MSGHSGGSGYSVRSSSSTTNGMTVQEVWIEGHGVNEHFEYHSPSSKSKSLSMFNSDGTLIIADPEVKRFLVYSDTPGSLVIMRDGVCTEKSYHTSSEGVTTSTSRQISESRCQEISKKAEEQLEKNRIYWNKWSTDFNKNMRDRFSSGFPFNSGPSGMFGGFANMHRNRFSGFSFY